ncbi:MAG: VanZ family protein [Solibacillus sp.]
MKKITFLLILSLCAVFYMSNTSYEQQSIIPELQYVLKDEPSKELLSQVELTFWGSPISVDAWGYHSFIELLIRKATHFSGYGAISVLFLLFYHKLQWKFPSLLAVLSIVIIASLDEYNQSFIPSRTGAVQDVVIDVLGALTFVTVTNLILYVLKRHRSSKEAHLFSSK